MTKNIIIYIQNIGLQNLNIRLTKHLPQNILAIQVEFIWSQICQRTHVGYTVQAAEWSILVILWRLQLYANDG